MIVVSDTSVITNLLQLGQLSLLKELFKNIIIPQKVFDELARIPKQIEIINENAWIEARQISDEAHFKKLIRTLDTGEAEAIVLAIELKTNALKKGRRIAQEYGITITGLLGILIEAKADNLIKEVKPILDRLIFEMGFRISPKLHQNILERVDE